MIKNAIGLIETVGLAAGVEAADVAVKSANVRLIGYELTKGDGMCTVKIEGDVGAVKAAVDSAKAAVSKMGKIYSTHVIPRPAQGLENLIFTKETVGFAKKEEKAPVQVETAVGTKSTIENEAAPSVDAEKIPSAEEMKADLSGKEVQGDTPEQEAETTPETGMPGSSPKEAEKTEGTKAGQKVQAEKPQAEKPKAEKKPPISSPKKSPRGKGKKK